MNKATIGVFALAMMMTGAVDGIANLPSIALFGQQLVFFFIAGALLFLLPTGLISAELCSHYHQDSGVYFWSKKAYGPHMGAFAVWLQWINTMVWFPTTLATLTGTFAYIVFPKIAHNPFYLVGASLAVFWTMSILNLKGIKRATRIASLGTMIGMVIPMILIISLCILWLVLHKPMALHLTHQAILPPLSQTGTWTSLTAVITAFLGMELATVHVRKIHNAARIFPKALGVSILFILFTMGLGSLGVALVIPNHEIVLVTGTVQAFDTLFTGFHLAGLERLVGMLLIFGSLGTMVNWLISPAGGLAHAAADGYLPKALAKENQHHVPGRVLMAQAIVVSLTSMAFFLMPSINGSYWLLLDLSTELYVIMYILMFISSLKLISRLPAIHIIPG